MILFKLLKRYGYISFDIFDTLIKRDVASAKDVFTLVEFEYNRLHPEHNISDFCVDRCNWESNARKASKGKEVTIDEIYSYSLYDEEIREILLHLEIQTELKVCHENYKIKKLYNELLNAGKQIVIISDMYLPENIVRKILDDAGYRGYYKLFLSSSLNRTKASGELFKYVLEDLNIKPWQILHIGDHKRHDCINAIKCGRILPVWVRRNEVNISYLTKNEIYNSDFNQRMIYSIINNRVNSFDNSIDTKEIKYAKKFGYSILGPVLYGMCQWIHKESKKQNLDKLYFLARDGFYIKETYDLLFPQSEQKTYYFRVSRRSLQLPYFQISKDKKVFQQIFTRNNLSLKEICKSFNLDPFDYTDIDFNVRLTMQNLDKNEEAQKFLKIVWKDLLNNAKIQSELFSEYAETNCMTGKFGIVDLGWHDTIQQFLNQIIGLNNSSSDIYGFYLGCAPRNKKEKGNLRSLGYWFNHDSSYDDARKKLPYSLLIERMFLERCGSTTGYTKKNGAIIPTLGALEDIDFSIIEAIQDGGMKFVKDISNLLPGEMDVSADTTMRPLERFAHNPSLNDAILFGNMIYEELGTYYIAKPKNILSYIFTPKSLIKDTKAALWKEGFIKRLLPYYINVYKVTNILRKF